jgi:hypothetical protein
MFRDFFGKRNIATQGSAAEEPWVKLAQHLRDGMQQAGVFKPDRIEVAVHKIGSVFAHIDNLTCLNALDEGHDLSAVEKKSMGLNARRKYSEGFISFIDLQSINGRCPKAIYQNVYMDAWHRTRREIELARMRKLSAIKTVEILSIDDCSAVRDAARIYAINDTPPLPLSGCDIQHCRCSYIVGPIDFD